MLRRTVRVHAQVSPDAGTAPQFTEDRIAAALADLGGAVQLSHGGTAEAFEAALTEAEVLFLTGQAPLHDLSRRAPKLRWISCTSAGVEGLLKLDLPRQVVLTNASGTHEPKAAEFTLTAVLMLNNQLPQLMTAQRAHRWAPRPASVVAGKTALILGMGALGGAAATALKAQGMRVVGNSRSGRPHPSVDVMTAGDGFRTHLPAADFLVIALPLTPETHGLIGRAELDLLPRHAGVVNIGRGEQLDAVALAAKLREGSLAGAVLDALPQEPLPEDSPLWDTPNLVVTAHCGLYDPVAYGPRCLDLFRANLRRFLAGEALHQVVERGRGY
ncbi:D-2-hydroxyacid dehydrogenase [Falsiroseomonas sp.]|uniref:D-2-hydroxyacid dehydrogenase n=1 Tax=Falsiroseomonas sp. TaxID=2870721 RepID=UPI003566B206